MDIPNFITHYYPSEDPPFRNLSEVPKEKHQDVISLLAERRKQQPNFHRRFGIKYISLRLATEEKLRSLFLTVGGEPERLAPHYFVLGSSKWFEGLYPSTKRVVLPISQLDTRTTSVTYPDSFTAMRLGETYGMPPESLKPYHNRVYLLSELSELVKTYGIPPDDPDADYSDYAREPFEKYIEVQVWSDKPVRSHLSAV